MNIPILSGACVIENGKLLLLQQRDDGVHPGKWGTPGGHGNENESLVEVAVRETKEETNLDIEISGLVQSVLAFSTDSKAYVVTLYLARAKNLGEMKIDRSEAKDFAWASLDEIKSDEYEFRDPRLKPILIKALSQKVAPTDSFIILKLESNVD